MISKETESPFVDEPDDYSEVRSGIEKLMQGLASSKREVLSLNNYAVFREIFGERLDESVSKLTDVIYLLGEIHGYSIADDIVEKSKATEENK